MATIAPDTTESAAPGWLGSFLETWEPGTGAPIEDREPATGRHLATVPGSTPDDVARAAEPPRRPPSRPGPRRATRSGRAILRRAAEIYEANRDEFGTWTQRETGASHSKMHHESNFAYHEILNAATLPSQAYGSLMPSAVKGRLSMVRRVPVGRHRRDHAVELAVRARDARRRAGPGARATPSSSSRIRRRRSSAARCSRPSSAKPACRRACSRSWSAGRTSARRSSPTRTSRSCRSPGSTAVGRRVGQLAGGHAQEGLARARWEQRLHRPRRRGPRRRGGRGRVLVVPVPGPGLLRGRAPSRPPSDSPTTYTEALTEKAKRLRTGRSVPRGRAARSDRQREAGRPRRRHRPALDRRRAPSSPRAPRTRACSTDRPCSPSVTPDMPAFTDEIFGPVAPITVFETDEEAIALANASSYGLVGVDLHALARPRPGDRRPDADRHGPHQRRHAQRRGDRSRSAGWAMSGNGSRYGGEASLDTFTEWQWVTVRDEPPTFPF